MQELDATVVFHVNMTEVVLKGSVFFNGHNSDGGVAVSTDPDNRLVKRPNGLYVRDDLVPDPLAYYILAKN